MYEHPELEDSYTTGESTAFNAGRDAFIGYAVGSYLDRTRFGIWFNNAPIINFIYWCIKWGIILVAITLTIWFIIILITQNH